MPPELQDTAINNVWASSTPSGVTELRTLPSGQVVQARKMGAEGLLRAGLMSEVDELSAFVSKIHVSKKKRSEEESLTTLMKDQKAFGAVVLLMDRAMPHIIQEPKVKLHLTELKKPDESGATTAMIPLEDRESDCIYTDQIPLADKVDLVNWAMGGIKQLETFRQESSTPVAILDDVQGVPVSSKRAGRNGKSRRR